MSALQVQNCHGYETAYGHSFGYNQRAQTTHSRHFDRTWQQRYPDAEVIRRQSVSAGGYDQQRGANLYVRSSNVRNSITDQQGLNGAVNRLDSYAHVAAGPDADLYGLPLDKDGELRATIRGGRSTFFGTSERGFTGTRAAVANAGRPRSRAESVQLEARWSSNHTALGLLEGRTTNYDSEYTRKFNNLSALDRSRWMRNSTKAGHRWGERDLEAPSRTKREASTRAKSDRYITHAKLWDSVDVVGSSTGFVNQTYPDRPADKNDFNLRNHIPQYRNALSRSTLITPNPSLGVKNIGPPDACGLKNKMWGGAPGVASNFENRVPTLGS